MDNADETVMSSKRGSDLSFRQEIVEAQTEGGIPLLVLDYWVCSKDLKLSCIYLSILTPAIGFGLNGGGRDYSLSAKARTLIKEGTDFISSQVTANSAINFEIEPFVFEDFEPEDLEVQWLELSLRSGLEKRIEQSAAYLNRLMGLDFPNADHLVQLQSELLEEGYDLSLFRDILNPYAKLVESIGDRSNLIQLQAFILRLPRALRGMAGSEKGCALGIISLAIGYLVECQESDDANLGVDELNCLSELVMEDHQANCDHYEELAFPIAHDPYSPPCVENLEYVLSKRRELSLHD